MDNQFFNVKVTYNIKSALKFQNQLEQYKEIQKCQCAKDVCMTEN